MAVDLWREPDVHPSASAMLRSPDSVSRLDSQFHTMPAFQTGIQTCGARSVECAYDSSVLSEDNPFRYDCSNSRIIARVFSWPVDRNGAFRATGFFNSTQEVHGEGCSTFLWQTCGRTCTVREAWFCTRHEQHRPQQMALPA